LYKFFPLPLGACAPQAPSGYAYERAAGWRQAAMLKVWSRPIRNLTPSVDVYRHLLLQNKPAICQCNPIETMEP